MRIGVVSDTHGYLPSARRAAEILAEHKIEQVLHCGDIGTPEIVQIFSRWPAHYVFGNCDHDTTALSDAIELVEQICHGEFGEIDLAGCPIALVHGHDHRRFQQAVSSQAYRLVCYGHTHVPERHYELKTLVLNPGALFRANPRTIAVVELPSLEVESLVVD
ncbi:MAG TPA: YfcE family phosphodiesterase [Planctomycetaceae bacterium]|jgi:putative phosphoesterase|nr:YfcE family phosphodiesterase [Planctomycetaceae bacterium]